MVSVLGVVRGLMNDEPELYLLKPQAYANRDKLVLRVSSLLGRRVNPETVTRAQRKVWSESVKNGV